MWLRGRECWCGQTHQSEGVKMWPVGFQGDGFSLSSVQRAHTNMAQAWVTAGCVRGLYVYVSLCVLSVDLHGAPWYPWLIFSQNGCCQAETLPNGTLMDFMANSFITVGYVVWLALRWKSPQSLNPSMFCKSPAMGNDIDAVIRKRSWLVYLEGTDGTTSCSSVHLHKVRHIQ